MARALGFLGAFLLAVGGGCTETDESLVDGVFTQAEWAKISTLTPLADLPKDTTNKYADDPSAAKLGQSLFHDTRFSGPIITGDDGTNGGNGKVGETGKVA